jgi:hypothetical protein
VLLPWANEKIIVGITNERRAMAAHAIADPQFRDISGYIDYSDFIAANLAINNLIV